MIEDGTDKNLYENSGELPLIYFCSNKIVRILC